MDDGPRTEIPRATYRALSTHGYADLTRREIAAGSDRSRAPTHYYDAKDGLFDAFFDLFYEAYVDRIDAADDRSPALTEYVGRHPDAPGPAGADGAVEVTR